MKQISVPFMNNPNTRCTLACFGMGLAHFSPEKKYSMQDLEEFCGYKEGHGTWKAVAMLNLAKLGYHVHWIEQFDYDKFAADPKAYLRSILDDEAYENQIANTDLELEARRMQEYIEKGLPLENRQATNEDIKHFIDDGWLVHLEVNARPLAGKTGYDGHSILVTGYNDDEVIIQNPDGDSGNKPNQHVSWDLLDQAWKEFGGSYTLHAFKK
ncbi:MAG: hypothetical protein NTX11_03965 [Candidatus Saccharibacteria bacterium]|nr:hypothetical protein [Candidatus Saccharibacteria bacterium]